MAVFILEGYTVMYKQPRFPYHVFMSGVPGVNNNLEAEDAEGLVT